MTAPVAPTAYTPPPELLDQAQTPTFRRRPPGRIDSFGQAVGEFTRDYGLTPDRWQAYVLDDWTSINDQGKWCAYRAGLAVPRQNGKNGLVEMRELFGMAALGEKFLHTAHEVKTARKAFLRLLEFFDQPQVYPELSKLVESVRRTNGQEAIYLHNGGSIEFIARSKSSGRGYSVDVLVLDEAQELDNDQLAALQPTISSAPLRNAQMVFIGTPPTAQTNLAGMGSVFTKFRENSHDLANTSASCWAEWAADPACDLDDPDQWYRTNPALGDRLSILAVTEEREAMDDATFGRERLGQWSEAGGNRVIPDAWWRPLARYDLVDGGGEVAFGFDVSPARNQASVVASGISAEGVAYVDVVQQRQGPPDWLPAYLEELVGRNKSCRALVADATGPAANVIDQILARGLQVTQTSAADMASAYAVFYDSVAAETLHHLDQPPLNLALAAARRRRLRDGFAWSRKDAQSDISPVVAASLALWGLKTTHAKRPRRKTGRAVFS